MPKTLTFAILHFSIAFGIAYALTGDFLTGGLIAVLEPACNTVAYYFHEKLWNRLNKKAAADGGDAAGHGHSHILGTLRRMLRRGES
ncbi:DUF2061 domain-containing protein [Ectopseudomonas hydrolytica]|uniref:DUF2061 domain-containing protein n=1 Tax=Ectopseudomonas hydrolytica TaxID=2493633 RepID=UPI0020B9014A|nr:DUF2061 domain-containing protein [Pseudomonas hydrolytica]UTH29307.1 DUF2061 domain-containing protein [Pseudomonas hydrolytica]